MMNMMTPDMPNTFTPDPQDTRRLRDAFGKFATGVTIVTCDSDEGPMCITANSFSSISLDPALVMWAVDKKSRRFPFFKDAQHFAIHVLGADQTDLCGRCSKNAKELANTDHITNPEGVPLIENCLARFECATMTCHDAGDHVIVVGEVKRAEMRDGAALTFFAGKFGRAEI